MSNVLVEAIAQNKETFADCRLYLYELFNKNRELVLKLEGSSIESCLPYYISYLEYKGINMQEAISHFTWDFPDTKYYDLLKITIVNSFRKLENNDLNFNSF